MNRYDNQLGKGVIFAVEVVSLPCPNYLSLSPLDKKSIVKIVALITNSDFILSLGHGS